MLKIALVLATLFFSRDTRREIEERIEHSLKSMPQVSSVSGTVTFAKDDFFFLQDGDEALKILHNKTISPKPGDVVSASGRPILEGGRLVLEAADLKKVGSSQLPMARSALSDQLVYAEGGERDINWLRVEVTGRAMGLTENGFSLDINGLPVSVAISKIPDFIEDCKTTHPEVSVKGVAELFLDQSVLFGRDRYVIGVRICVVSPEDVILKPDIGYFVRKRERRIMTGLIFVVVILGVGLLVLAFFAERHKRMRLGAEAVMGERKRMADDLHDTIEQNLAGAGMLLKLARMPQNNLPDVVDRTLQEAQDVLLRSKHEMRDIVWGLKNDDMMRLHPCEAIAKLSLTETRKGLFKVRSRIKGLPQGMTPSQLRDLSLIIREAIGNATKHGGARKIAIVSNALNNGWWRLCIANDGEAFDRSSVPGPDQGHFGLEGMNERARRIGAKLDFSTKRGWTIVTVEGKA
jgi:signal transduction histidine kinase